MIFAYKTKLNILQRKLNSKNEVIESFQFTFTMQLLMLLQKFLVMDPLRVLLNIVMLSKAKVISHEVLWRGYVTAAFVTCSQFPNTFSRNVAKFVLKIKCSFTRSNVQFHTWIVLSNQIAQVGLKFMMIEYFMNLGPEYLNLGKNI